MFGEFVILIAAIFIWIINKGQKPFSQISKEIDEHTDSCIFFFSKLLVFILLTGWAIFIVLIIYVSCFKKLH